MFSLFRKAGFFADVAYTPSLIRAREILLTIGRQSNDLLRSLALRIAPTYVGHSRPGQCAGFENADTSNFLN